MYYAFDAYHNGYKPHPCACKNQPRQSVNWRGIYLYLIMKALQIWDYILPVYLLSGRLNYIQTNAIIQFTCHNVYLTCL